jgi:hypothetical protein
MKSQLVKIAAGAAFGAAAMTSQAAAVYYADWAFGSGGAVNVTTPGHNGLAGGFKGSVTFSAAEQSQGFTDIAADSFISYCVEITEHFSGFPSALMADYSVQAASAYSSWGLPKASRLGQLMSYVASDAQRVDTAQESTSLQLAIWNVIYDDDTTLLTGTFKETLNAGFNAYADQLLTASLNTQNRYDVYVLSKSGSQDFLLLRELPEPTSLALTFAALGGMGLVARRRKD